MAEYILAFHGGSMPETPEEGEKVMAAWGAWMGALGDSITNPGAPVGMSKTVSAAGVVDNGGANPVSGFTIVKADSMEAACEMAAGCPINDSGGSVEVAEIMPM
jgi:hypothetical protein